MPNTAESFYSFEYYTTRTKIGYTNLTRHMHIIQIEKQLFCSQRDEPFTIKHIVLHCPLFTAVTIFNHPSTMKENSGEQNTH